MTPFNLPPPLGNFGFLGIVSDDPILDIEWFGNLGGIRNTGIDNLRFSESVGVVPEPALLALWSRRQPRETPAPLDAGAMRALIRRTARSIRLRSGLERPVVELCEPPHRR